MNYHGGDIYRYKDEMTDFSSNINPLGVPESFKEVLIGELSSVTRYPDRLYRKLTRSIHDYIEKREDEVTVVLFIFITPVYYAISSSNDMSFIFDFLSLIAILNSYSPSPVNPSGSLIRILSLRRIS